MLANTSLLIVVTLYYRQSLGDGELWTSVQSHGDEFTARGGQHHRGDKNDQIGRRFHGIEGHANRTKSNDPCRTTHEHSQPTRGLFRGSSLQRYVVVTVVDNVDALPCFPLFFTSHSVHYLNRRAAATVGVLSSWQYSGLHAPLPL